MPEGAAASVSWWQRVMISPVVLSPLLLLACGWALVKSATPRPMPYAVAILQAYAWPLVLLEVLCWIRFPWPWPYAGMNAWLVPAMALLAHVSVNYEVAPMNKVRWVRALVIAITALQSLWLLSDGVPKWVGLRW